MEWLVLSEFLQDTFVDEGHFKASHYVSKGRAIFRKTNDSHQSN